MNMGKVDLLILFWSKGFIYNEHGYWLKRELDFMTDYHLAFESETQIV